MYDDLIQNKMKNHKMTNAILPGVTFTDTPRALDLNVDSKEVSVKEDDPKQDPLDGIILLHFTIAVGLIFAALITALSILFILKTCE